MTIKLNKISIPLAIVLSSLVIAGTLIYVNSQKNEGNNSSGTPPQEVKELEGVFVADGEPALGKPDAPVTMIEYSDFQCPYCARHASETFPQIKINYADTGKVKIVFRNFPLPSHSFAKKAAEAAECALEQNKFWIYKEKLFENQESLSENNLKKYARELGLNTGQFNSCLDSGKYKSAVEKDLEAGQAAGLRATPTFFINGEKVEGAFPFSEFQKIIDGKLK